MPKTVMIRDFIPVGQGAFYVEKFANEEGRQYIYVYDCGSISISEKELKSIIHKAIHPKDKEGEKTTINGVFISHFDEDHINGLPTLLNDYNVENLFLPFLTEIEAITLALACWSKSFSKTSAKFFKTVFEDFPTLHLDGYQTTKVIWVREKSDKGKNDISLKNNNCTFIRSGDDIRKARGIYTPDNWLYIPFNFKSKERHKDLMNAFKKLFGEEYDNNKSLYSLKERLKNTADFKNVYKKVRGSMNSNSMTLYSGPKNGNYMQEIYDVFCRESRNSYSAHLPECTERSACLYTGDYEANKLHPMKVLKRAYNTVWDTIGCVQIPHHGSANGYRYNRELTECHNCYYVISAGAKNKYGHPDINVIHDMALRDINPIIVTEERISEALFRVLYE